MIRQSRRTLAALSWPSLLAATVIALILVAAVAPSALAGTLAQTRTRLVSWHLSPPPLFPTSLPPQLQNSAATLERWPGVDFDIVLATPDCAATNTCVDLRRLDRLDLPGILNDPANLSVEQIQAGTRTVYAIETGHAGAPAILAWNEGPSTYMAIQRYVSIDEALPTLVPLVAALQPLAATTPIDPCASRWSTGASHRRGGGRLIYDRSSSLRMVCQGFGTDTGGLHVDWLNWGMRCALLAAAIGTRYGDDSEFLAGGACSAVEIAHHPGVVSEVGAVCSTASALLGFPMPVLGRISGVACTEAPTVGSGFGTWLESHHQFEVAKDVVRHRRCIEYRDHLHVTSWHAVACLTRRA